MDLTPNGVSGLLSAIAAPIAAAGLAYWTQTLIDEARRQQNRHRTERGATPALFLKH